MENQNHETNLKTENQSESLEKKCSLCGGPLDQQAPSQKIIAKRYPKLYNEKMPAYLCYPCFMHAKKTRKVLRRHERALLRYNFDYILKHGQYHDFVEGITYLHNDLQKINKTAEKHIKALKRLNKRHLEQVDRIFYAYSLAEKKPEILYPEARKRANKAISNVHLRKKVFKKHGYKCIYCGAIEDITIDHIVPVVLGGTNELDNLQPLCKTCNSRKGKSVQFEHGETG